MELAAYLQENAILLLSRGGAFTPFLRACLHEGGGPQVGEVTCGGLPQSTCKRDHIKTRDCMDRRVTPPKRVSHLHVNRP